MIVTPWERRAAERFDDLLNEDHPGAHSDMGSLVTLTKCLERAGAGPSVDPAFRQRFRNRLIAVGTVQGIGVTAKPLASKKKSLARPRVPRRAALLSGTLAVLIGLSGVGVASNGAVPGDALYSIKRSREAAQLALAYSDLSRGRLHLQFAKTRLDEASSVESAQQRQQALDDMDSQTRSAMRELGGVAMERGNSTPLDLVDGFVTEQRQELSSLVSKLPAASKERAQDSILLLGNVSDRTEGLRTSLSCTHGLAEGARTDTLGPVPQRCAALPAVEPGGQPVGSDATETSQHSAATSSATPSGSPDGQTPSPTPSGTATPADKGVLGAVEGILGGLLGSLFD